MPLKTKKETYTLLKTDRQTDWQRYVRNFCKKKLLTQANTKRIQYQDLDHLRK